MAAYHQIGHQSDNLLTAEHLQKYAGWLLSPVNYMPGETAAQIKDAANRGLETIFDPQLYYPKSERGHLKKWKYFPSDVDTADLGSDTWWNAVIDRLVDTCEEIGPSAVCSPAIVPKKFDGEYFARLVRNGHRLAIRLKKSKIKPVQTAVTSLADLAIPKQSLAVASILSQTEVQRIYLVLVGTTHPRRELSDTEELKGAMRLISALKSAGLEVTVGFCSSDIVLWKAAGAADCATGKFFNLRRFTPSRFAEPAEGGGQLSYWFEEMLMANLRESDLIRVEKIGMLSKVSHANPFGQEVLTLIKAKPGPPWVGLGWRQFMYWFADIEERTDEKPDVVEELLTGAESNWKALDDAKPRILMEERQNDGSWIRGWRRALLEYRTH